MTHPGVPADPALPAFQRALDPDAMVEVFRRHLGDPCGVPIATCTVDRVRYRRGQRAVVQYSIDGDRWVSALLYPGDRPAQVWRKASRRLPERPDGPLPAAAFVPEAGMVLQVFPFDRRLPSLEVLVDPPVVMPAGAGAGVRHVEAVRYRAGLSCTLRWEREDSESWYVKASRDGQATDAFRLLHALRSDGDRGFELPEPVAELDELGAIVLAEVPGTPLTELLLRPGDPVSAMERVAGALAEFNQAPPLSDRRHGPEEELADARRAATTIGWVRPELGAQAEELVVAIEPRLRPASVGSAHADLKPDHLVLDARRVAVLDVDSMARAEPVLDPAALLARMAGLAERHPERRSVIVDAARTFSDRYFGLVPSGWREKLAPRYTAALLEEAASCFRRQERAWPDLMEALVERAGSALADGD